MGSGLAILFLIRDQWTAFRILEDQETFVRQLRQVVRGQICPEEAERIDNDNNTNNTNSTAKRKRRWDLRIFSRD